MITKQKVIFLFLIITFFRLFLAYFFPITGDEGYFYRWGQNLDTIYYDHPGLVGWWMWIAQFMGHSIFFARILPLAVGGAIAWGIYSIVKDFTQDSNQALMASLLYYTTPMSLLFVLISTDAPMILFVFFSGYFFLRSFKHAEIPCYILSAICLGLAFWSKYLMFFMIWALLLCAFLCLREWRRKFLYVLILAVIGFVFAGAHFYWSSQNCWWSVLFNVFNRDSETQFKFSNLLTYIVFIFYLTTPWVLIFIFKQFKTLRLQLSPPLKSIWILYAVPVLLLALPSSTYPNLHWPLSYIPFAFALIGLLPLIHFKRYLKYNLAFTGLHFIFLTILIFLPDSYFQSNKFYNDIIMGKYGDELEERLQQYKENYTFGTVGYTTSGLMHYHNKRQYLVFNDKDNNGRGDDKWTDYRSLDQKNILIISTYPFKPLQLEEYKNYFSDVIYEELNFRGATFFIARGHFFNYQNYRNNYLTWVKDQYYKRPSYLPPGQCFFFERYFPRHSSKETL